MGEDDTFQRLKRNDGCGQGNHSWALIAGRFPMDHLMFATIAASVSLTVFSIFDAV